MLAEFSISAVIPAHNPDPDHLRQTLLGLRGQVTQGVSLEVVLVNNASTRFPNEAFFSECAPSNFRIVAEPRLGLTAARLSGFAASHGDIVILVDDDNVLAPGYVSEAAKIAADYPLLASWSGNVALEFERGAVAPPAIWRGYLTERVCTAPIWSNDPGHHASTPWGAGMCVRRSLAEAYRSHCAVDPRLLKLDLSGQQLTYGGDTDIAFFGCRLGFGKGVFPQLRVRHLIPPERCEKSYLLRAAEGHAYSEYLHYWLLHGRLPAEPKGLAAGLKRILRRAAADPESAIAEGARAAGRARATREISTQR